MATASRLFEGQPRNTLVLLENAAQMLAATLGQACLVSVVTGHSQHTLEPIVAAHTRSDALRTLRAGLRRRSTLPKADAFSREVARTGGSLRLHIESPWMLGLWLPRYLQHEARRRGAHEFLASAICGGGRVVATLLVWRERGSPPFAEGDEAYVGHLARRLGVALTQFDGSGAPAIQDGGRRRSRA